MTLTEVAVYCALLSLFSLLLFVNLPTRGDIASEDLRAATSKADDVLERLTLELGNASATSVTTSANPVGLMFLSASRDGYADIAYTPDGVIAWQGWVGYFRVGDRLQRIWFPLSSPAARSAVTTTPSYAQMAGGGTVVQVANRISNFAVSSPEVGLWQVDITLAVGTSRASLSSGAGARN